MEQMPYVHDARHVSRVLDLVRRATTPGTVSASHLEANGFPAPSATQVLAFLQTIGLVEQDGQPSPAWTAYRDAADPSSVLAGLARDHYGPLADAVERGATTDADLERHVDSADPDTAALVVSTFRAVAERARIDLDRPSGPRRSRRDVLQDVSGLLQLSVGEFDAARTCLANDLTRPAHVAAWNSFAALAIAHLSTDDFAALRTRSDRATLSLDDLMRTVRGKDLLRLLSTHGLVPDDDMADLEALRRRRDDCAHPLLHAPDRAETADYLSAILSRSARLSEHPIT